MDNNHIGNMQAVAPTTSSILRRGGGSLVVAVEHRFTRYKGEIFSSFYTHVRSWCHYLQVFDRVSVLARVEDVDAAPVGQQLAGGRGVDWITVPYFRGPRQFLLRRAKVTRVISSAADSGGSFMLRVPGTIGTMLWDVLRRRRIAYGVEVVGDPYEVFAPGANNSPIRPLARWFFTRKLRTQCRDASVAAYVTREALQKRYPTRGWSTHYSSAQLGDEAFISAAELEARVQRYLHPQPDREWVCVHVGSMSQIYKRQDALIRATSECRARGVRLRLRLVGGGHLLNGFRKLADEYGVSEHVEFLGQLPAGQAIRDVLDSADIFVLPSMTEGLPRVIIEAMARGLPCLASNVGGVPELLDASERFEIQEINNLGRRIETFVNESHHLASIVLRNHARASEYHVSILQERRFQCYRRLAAIGRDDDLGSILKAKEVPS